MADFEVWSVSWFLCVMCVALVEIQCQLVKEYGVCVISWKQADMMHGFQQWQDMLTGSGLGMKHVHYRWCVSYRHVQLLTLPEQDIGWVVQRIVPDQLDYRKVCTQWVLKNRTDDKLIVWDCMGLSCIHTTCYTDEREQFWSWNMVNYTKPETRKRMCDR